MRLFTKPKPDPADVRAQLREAVHGIQRTCGACGVHGEVQPDTVIVLDTLRGEGLYGLCGRCMDRQSRSVLDRIVAAELLDLAATDPALDGLHVPRFTDRPGHDPDRPNARPFEHVDVNALAAHVVANRAALAKRTGGPCTRCGTTLAAPGTGWQVLTSGETVCSTCYTVGVTWGHDPEAIRNIAAAALLTGQDPTMRSHMASGLGRTLGLKLWSELATTTGHPEPWHHADVEALRHRAATDPIVRGDHFHLLECYDPATAPDPIW